MYDLAISDNAKPLLEKVKTFIADEIDPVTAEFFSLMGTGEDRWSYTDRQLEILDGLKAKARAEGLWNFFLPDSETGEGLSNLDYAYLAQEMGKNHLASECFNCSAPDTGNMEVLERFGTPEQKKQWLEPLLNGEIRSCYGMTEPDLASSDAKNIATRAVLEGDEWVINGEKYYISGAGDPRCKIMICMVKTSPDAEPYRQQSQILVPMDTPGVDVVEADAGIRPRHGAPRPHADHARQRPGSRRQRDSRRGSRLRDLSGEARPGQDPPLHAGHRSGRAGA